MIKDCFKIKNKTEKLIRVSFAATYSHESKPRNKLKSMFLIKNIWIVKRIKHR